MGVVVNCTNFWTISTRYKECLASFGQPLDRSMTAVHRPCIISAVSSILLLQGGIILLPAGLTGVVYFRVKNSALWVSDGLVTWCQNLSILPDRQVQLQVNFGTPKIVASSVKSAANARSQTVLHFLLLDSVRSDSVWPWPYLVCGESLR